MVTLAVNGDKKSSERSPLARKTSHVSGRSFGSMIASWRSHVTERKITAGKTIVIQRKDRQAHMWPETVRKPYRGSHVSYGSFILRLDACDPTVNG